MKETGGGPAAPVRPAHRPLQVLAGDGVHEVRSSARALLRALDEAAALLSAFWRAALPGPGGEAVRPESLPGP